MTDISQFESLMTQFNQNHHSPPQNISPSNLYVFNFLNHPIDHPLDSSINYDQRLHTTNNKLSMNLESTHIQQNYNLSESEQQQFIQTSKVKKQIHYKNTLTNTSQQKMHHQFYQNKNLTENRVFKDIFNSPILNKKCLKCTVTLLNSNPALSWMQCGCCLELRHKFCQIIDSEQCKNNPICFQCSTKVATTKRAVIKKRIRKIQRKRSLVCEKRFKQKVQCFRYLDSFVSSFSYRMSISEQQIRKDIVRLKREFSRWNEYSS